MLYNHKICTLPGTVDDIKHELSLHYPIDNRNGDKK